MLRVYDKLYFCHFDIHEKPGMLEANFAHRLKTAPVRLAEVDTFACVSLGSRRSGAA